MPWNTPTLREVRGIVRDNVRATLPGADASVPNSVLRVLSDNQGALCHLTLQYIDWLALQLLPDTAEHEWLDRHGHIWLVNADNSTGRKLATFAAGTAEFTGLPGTVVPIYTRLQAKNTVGFETVVEATLGVQPTAIAIRALDPGISGNLEPGDPLAPVGALPGIESAVALTVTGGVDTENDDDLRARVLSRIRQPPQGGAAHDYVNWALAVPGVTRAWAASEMGMGTVTVRFMMDVLRGPPPGTDNDGFPNAGDIAAVEAYLDVKRPVTVKDMFVVSPIPQPIDVFIRALEPDTESVRAGIQASIKAMLRNFAAPGQTIFTAWKYTAIMNTADVVSFSLINTADDVMPSPGHMAVLGDISFN